MTSLYYRILSTYPLAYWPLNEASGLYAFDNTFQGYTGTHSNVVLGQAGIGDGNTSTNYNGTTSKTNIYSPALSPYINWNEITIQAWARVSGTSTWTDATRRDLIFLINNAETAFFAMYKFTTQYQFIFDIFNTKKIFTGPYMDWMHLVIRASKSGNFCDAYCNNVQIGTTSTYAGASEIGMRNNQNVIGANHWLFVTNGWKGSIAHVAIWTRALSRAEIENLSYITLPAEPARTGNPRRHSIDYSSYGLGFLEGAERAFRRKT